MHRSRPASVAAFRAAVPAALAALAALALGLPGAARASSPVETHALAVSWEPAFCLTHASKPECQTETSSRWDAWNFSLHGLWPQNGTYCGVSSTEKTEDQNGQWSLLPEVVLDTTTESNLQVEMPGTQSYLDRHEWIEHGTCSGYTQQDFFAPTLGMLDSINASNLGATVAGNAGSYVYLSDLQNAAAIDFGYYAKTDIEYLCLSYSGRYYLQEVRFHMHLPDPLPSSVQASYMAKPLYPASSTQLCKSTTPIWIATPAY